PFKQLWHHFFVFCSVNSSMIICLLLCLNAGAQVLDNSKGNAFTDKPFFNKNFIRNNKIKTISGRFNYKKSGQAIYTTDFFYVYSFDEEGNLDATFETRTD